MRKLLIVISLLSAVLVASHAPASEATHVSDFGMLGSVDVPRVKRGLTVNAARTHDAWCGAAETFVRGYTGRRGAEGSESFAARNVIEDEIGQVHVRVGQSIAGLPVVGAELILHVEAESGRVIGINGSFAPDSDLPRSAAVNAGAAIEYAVAEYGIASSVVVGAPKLTYIVVEEDDSVRLAWTNVVSYHDEDGEQIDRIFADALTGAAIARHPQIHHAKNREIYDCGHTTVLPGTLLFTEGDSSGDSTAMAAYNNLGIAYDYYKNKHNRDSYNNNGATIKACVHYGNAYNNAAWAPQGMFWFGDGDGVQFSPFPFSLDIVAHEFTHAVNEYTAGLVGTAEPGALSESIADCLAAAAEAYSDGSVNAAVWKIGDEVYTPGTSGDALRYLNDPAINGDRDYYPGRSSSGTHSNAGIQNLAFYLLVQGGSHPRGKTFFNVSSIGMTAAEKIFYRALVVYADGVTNFREMRDHTRKAAEDLYGTNSTQHTAVFNAWAAVGNHWLQDSATMATGDTIITSTYTSSYSSNYHTGHLDGPTGSNFALYLERWDGTAWQVVASDVSAGSDEVLAYKGATGMYRWRIYALAGSGTFTLYSNRP